MQYTPLKKFKIWLKLGENFCTHGYCIYMPCFYVHTTEYIWQLMFELWAWFGSPHSFCLLLGGWGKGRRGEGPVFKQTMAWERRGRVQVGYYHKVLTYVEYRAVSGVFQNIDPPTPSPPSECVLSPHQRRGAGGTPPPPSPPHRLWCGEGTHSLGGEGVKILEDARPRIGLLQYNLSTDTVIREKENGWRGGGETCVGYRSFGADLLRMYFTVGQSRWRNLAIFTQWKISDKVIKFENFAGRRFSSKNIINYFYSKSVVSDVLNSFRAGWSFGWMSMKKLSKFDRLLSICENSFRVGSVCNKIIFGLTQPAHAKNLVHNQKNLKKCDFRL
jgi:hypothetical protein